MKSYHGKSTSDPFVQRVLFSFVILMHFVWQGAAQNVEVIDGKIMDRQTHEVLPYASVTVANKSIGTISNQQGEYKLAVPAAFSNDSLRVTYLGYKTFSEKISNLKKSHAIYLEAHALTLKEVAVHDNALTARQIVERAKVAIPSVFSTEPYLMEAFFRSWEKVDFPDSIYPGTLLEAAVVIYDAGYGNSKSEKIYSQAIRRSRLMPGWNFSVNGVAVVLKENDVKYPKATSFNFIKSFLDFPQRV
jgi:hypothetical protein